MTSVPEVTYVLPDKLGGVFNYVSNLLANRRDDGFRYTAVLTDNLVSPDTRSRDPLPADRVEKVRFRVPPDNLYSVLRQVSAAVRPGPGVLVANDWIELAAVTMQDTGRTVVAINHGDFDFYYDLAARHQNVIDVFVALTEPMRARLRERLPDRHDSIVLLPHGVEIPSERRAPAAGPLRLLYVGRLNEQKGVFDFPAIDRRLRDQGVPVTWTMQGTGPDADALKAAWSDRGDVHWNGYQPMEHVLQLYATHDVLVMPSRGEGLPVALLEAGAAGVVPVISNLASGIPDVVEPGVTGFRPEIGDIAGFANAIVRLAEDRNALERMSVAVRERVRSRYDTAARTADYQALFAQWATLRRPRPAHLPMPYGSRLDQPWIPNVVTRLARGFSR